MKMMSAVCQFGR